MHFVFALLWSVVPAHALWPAVNGAALADDLRPWNADLAWRRAEVITRATPGGERTPRERNESIRTLTGRASRGFGAWHVGGELQVSDRDRSDSRSTALSQGAVNGGISGAHSTSYLQLTLPVSRSAYEIEDAYQLNALGRGFFALGVGQSWHVEADPWQIFAAYELHHSFDRPFSNAKNSGYLEPGWGFNWMVGVGRKFARIQVTLTVSQTYEDPVAVHGNRQSRGGSSQRFFQGEAGVAWTFGDGWSLGVSYADQTPLPAANSDLMREVGLTLAGHWD